MLDLSAINLFIYTITEFYNNVNNFYRFNALFFILYRIYVQNKFNKKRSVQYLLASFFAYLLLISLNRISNRLKTSFCSDGFNAFNLFISNPSAVSFSPLSSFIG